MSSSPSLSRRGFFTRAAAGTVGLIGSSAVGGFATRAWATPLRDLRAGPHLPRVGKPKSIVQVGLDAAAKRERDAYKRPEVRALVSDLENRGYERLGAPLGVDGVDGYVGEGGHAVGLGFGKIGSEEASVTLIARWWDQVNDRCELEDMPDVFSTEVFPGSGDMSSLVRFRYVGDNGAVEVRDQIADPRAACEPVCHPHPPGPCHPDCPGAACVHCIGPTNICHGTDPDCMDQCTLCPHCLLVPHWAYAALCVITCNIYCEEACANDYCCDYIDTKCCSGPPGLFGIPVPQCL